MATLTYQTYGTSDKPALLLLHGAGCFDTFCHQYAMLAEHFHVILPHLPGSGESVQTDYCPETLLTDLFGLMEPLSPQPFYILGHSIGAQLAVAFACRYPGLVRRAVFLSPWLRASDRMRSLYTKLAVTTYRSLQSEFFVRLQARLWGLNAAQSDAFTQDCFQLPSSTYSEFFRRRILLPQQDGSFPAGIHPDAEDYPIAGYDCVTMPMLAICATHELGEIKSSVAALARQNKNCRALIFPHGSHDFVLRYWKALNPILLQFLLES